MQMTVEADTAEDPLEKRKKGLSKHAGMLLELCYATLSGLGDKGISEIIKDGSLACLRSVAEDASGALCESVRELRVALQTHRRIIAVEAGSAAPPPCTRTLTRYDSQTDESSHSKAAIDQERNGVWKNAQGCANRVVVWSRPHVHRFVKYANGGAINNLKGKVAEYHLRLRVLC